MRKSLTLIMTVILVVGMLPLASITFAGTAEASEQTYIVAADGTGDYTDIQSAINAAEPGDTIIVEDGTYAESTGRVMDISTADLTIVAADGARPKVIAEEYDQAAIYIDAHNTRIEGFYAEGTWPVGIRDETIIRDLHLNSTDGEVPVYLSTSDTITIGEIDFGTGYGEPQEDVDYAIAGTNTPYLNFESYYIDAGKLQDEWEATVSPTDPAADYTTIQDAYDNSHHGGTIYIGAGEYDFGPDILEMRTSMTLIGDGADVTSITSNATSLDTLTFENPGPDEIIKLDSEVTIEGLSIHSADNGAVYYRGGTTGTIRQSSLTGGGAPLYAASTASVDARYNYFGYESEEDLEEAIIYSSVVDYNPYYVDSDMTILSTDFGEVSGTVIACSPLDADCTDGPPVSNAVVEGLLINYDMVEEYVQNEGESLEDAVDRVNTDVFWLEPDDWDDTIRVVDIFDGDIADDGEPIVVVNHIDDWGLDDIDDDVNAENTVVHMDSYEPYVLTAWDATESSYFEDHVDDSLPGQTVPGGEVEFRQIAPTGETLGVWGFPLNQEYNTQTTALLGWGPGKTHNYAVAYLPPGFYEVTYIDDDGEESKVNYIVKVGTTHEILSNWQTEETDLDGELTLRAQMALEYIENGVIEPVRTRADADGTWEIELPIFVGDLHFSAYKSGDKLDGISTENASFDRLLAEIEGDSSHSSVLYAPTAPVHAEVTDEDVTVRTVRIESPQDPDEFHDWLDVILSVINEDGYFDLGGEIWEGAFDDLSGIDTSTDGAEELYEDLTESVEENPELVEAINERFEEEGLGDLDDDVSTIDDDELYERISIILEEINEVESITDAEETTESITDGLMSAEIPFGFNIGDDRFELDGITVVAHHDDGSQAVIDEEYLSLDQNALGTTQTVVITDYPLPEDVSTAYFSVTAINADGKATATTNTITDPSSPSQGPPSIDAIVLDTIRLQPGESMRMSATSDDPRFGALGGIDVHSPAGDIISGTPASDGTVSAELSHDGAHTIRYTVSDSDGNEYVDYIRLRADDRHSSIAPPSIRVRDSMFGTIAIVSDGITDAQVDARAGDARVVASVSDGASGSVHVYLTDRDVSQLSVRLLDDYGRSLDRHRSVVVHLPELSDGALVRAHEKPVGTQYGEIEHRDAGSTLTTYAEDGRIDIEIDKNPSFIDKVRYRIDSVIETHLPSIPFLTVPTFDFTIPFATTAVINR